MNSKLSSAMTNSSLVFNQLLVDKTPVTLILDRGEKLTGQLTGWDEHYLLLVNESKLQVVPSWRLLWLESNLEEVPPVIHHINGEPEKAAEMVTPPDPQPQSETPGSIPQETAAAAEESPVPNPIGTAPQFQPPEQSPDVPPSQEAGNKSPLDHLEQLVKNW